MRNKRFKKILVTLILTLVVTSGVIEIPSKVQALTNWEYNPGDTVSIIDGKLYAIDQQLIKSEAVIQNTQNPPIVIEKELEWKAKLLRDKLELIEEKNKLEPIPDFNQAIENVQNQLEATTNQWQAMGGAAAGGEDVQYESCGWFSFNIPCWIRNGITFIGVIFKSIFGGILWVVGLIFDYSVKFSISDFRNLVIGPTSAVETAWKVLRDVANLFFIFILLYAAIGMILQLPSVNGKRILVSVIIAALLINFSAFFTRLVIDASNVAAYQFYKAIGGAGDKSISTQFMNALPLGTAFSLTEVKGGLGDKVEAEFMEFVKVFVLAFGTVIMLLVAIFVFLVATILFAVRTVTLILLIILSPLAFLMYAFPNQKGLFDKWGDTLLKQAFFAPLYLLMIYVTLKVLESPAVLEIRRASGEGFANLVFYYLIAIGLMLGSIIIAKSLGAKGASAAMKGAGALTGAATGAALWGSKQLRRVGVAAGAGVAGGAGAIFGKGAGIRKFATSQLKDIKTDTQKIVTSGQGKIGKAVREFTQAPIKKTLGITAGGLAAVTKDYGIGGILGRTKDEEAEARKKEKERKEAENKAELKRKGDQLRGNPPNAASIMASIKDKDISEIDSKVLIQHGQYMRASQLAEASKHLDHNDRTAIRNSVFTAVGVTPGTTPPPPVAALTTGTPEQRQAYEWLTQNNAGKIF